MTFARTALPPRAFLIGLVFALSAAACGGSSPTAPTQDPTWIANVPFSTVDSNVGSGDEAVAGSTVRVDYYGFLYSTATSDNKGSLFDTSCPSVCTPIEFTIGANQVIRGFEQGVLGMRPGGIRRVTIPPDLAYGSTGNGSVIPPNATIIFEIRLNSTVTPG